MPLLCLMRHGPAEADGDDPSLTLEGEAVVQDVAVVLAGLGLSFDAVWSSPLARARHTAAIVADVLGGPRAVEPIEELMPGHPVSALADRAARTGVRGSVLAVGHQPDMGRMAREAIRSALPLPFHRGTVAAIEVPDWESLASGRAGWLAFHLPPDLRPGR